jgi:hypothetical protein
MTDNPWRKPSTEQCVADSLAILKQCSTVYQQMLCLGYMTMAGMAEAIRRGYSLEQAVDIAERANEDLVNALASADEAEATTRNAPTDP